MFVYFSIRVNCQYVYRPASRILLNQLSEIFEWVKVIFAAFYVLDGRTYVVGGLGNCVQLCFWVTSSS